MKTICYMSNMKRKNHDFQDINHYDILPEETKRISHPDKAKVSGITTGLGIAAFNPETKTGYIGDFSPFDKTGHKNLITKAVDEAETLGNAGDLLIVLAGNVPPTEDYVKSSGDWTGCSFDDIIKDYYNYHEEVMDWLKGN